MKTILLATDGSAAAEHAADFLAHLPHDKKYTLLVVSALTPPYSPETTLSTKWIEISLEQDRTAAMDAFARIAKRFEGANVDLKHVIEKGHAGEAVCRIARENKGDLVVIGATGHSMVARIVLGSTSDYVATHAPCSVLVVRPQETPPSRAGLRVALGYEATGPAQAALEEIEEFKWGKNVELHVVSVFVNYGLFPSSAIDEARINAKNAAEVLRSTGASTESHLVESDHLGEGLVKYAQDHRCDLFFVGETPRTRLDRILMGSTTRYVLRHAPCSVWITRNRMISGVKKQPRASETAST